MQYRPPKKPLTRTLLVSRGVPQHIFGIPSFEVDDYIHNLDVPASDGFIEFTRKRQLEYVKEFLNDPFSKPLTVISSNYYLDKPQAIAFLAARMALANKEQRLPLWHYLTGSYRDKLRDDEGYRVRIGKPGFLILDGLTSTSTQVKLEKAHDLLEMYGTVPKVILCCGEDPISFVRSHLHVRPTGFIYLGDSKVVEI